MAEIIITISLKPGTTRLELSDKQGKKVDPKDFISEVEKGDTLNWQLVPNSGIDAITGIVCKTGKFTIFNNGDPKSKQDGSWSGKIKTDATGANAYNINYLINGTAFSEDPEIKVKPTP